MNREIKLPHTTSMWHMKKWDYVSKLHKCNLAVFIIFNKNIYCSINLKCILTQQLMASMMSHLLLVKLLFFFSFVYYVRVYIKVYILLNIEKNFLMKNHLHFFAFLYFMYKHYSYLLLFLKFIFICSFQFKKISQSLYLSAMQMFKDKYHFQPFKVMRIDQEPLTEKDKKILEGKR